MIDHIRKAVTVCQTFEYYNIGGVVLNPEDFEILETAKATDGHYILVPFAATNDQTQQIWRVPVIITNAMPKDNFILGDWSMGARVRDRESVSIRVAEQHGELFVKNGVVVLAEERYVLTIPRPKAFTKGLFTVSGA
jgi:HK97 family phage major capsid protein